MYKGTIDLTGKKFNLLTAISYSHSNDGAFWNFECECGNITTLRGSAVSKGFQKSCGCLAKATCFKSKIILEVGGFINNLKVLSNNGKNGHNTEYTFECFCGKIFNALLSNVTSGNTTSCGCVKKVLAKENNTIHGMAGTSHYSLWNSMMRRCYNKKNPAYKNYGARGIDVCERWHSFELFFQDMGKKPKGKSLERKDNYKGYTPENCVWATAKDQGSNKRNNVIITDTNGISKTVSQWAEIYGINHNTIRHRLKKGYSIEKMFIQPFKKTA